MAVPRLGSLEGVERADLGWYFDPSFTVYVRFGGAGGSSRLELQA